LVAPKQPRGSTYTDYCHCYAMPDPAPGAHRAVAVVEELSSGKQSSRTLDFTA
jgi:hypothetical protein